MNLSYALQPVRMLMRVVVAALLLTALQSTALAQLNGTKTVGATGDYASLDAALTDLVNLGVNGPVTFLIQSGRYTPPAAGYTLPAVNGMSSTNTVTIKPAPSATVAYVGTTDNGTGIFTFDGGKYFIIDGSNSNGGTSRDLTILQTSTTYSAAIWLRNDADFNVIKNSIIQSANGTGGLDLNLGGITLFVGQPGTTAGNDSNLIQNNMVGDPNGTYRGFRAIYVYGASTDNPNIGTRIIGNDVVNFGNLQPATYGIFVSYHNVGTIVKGNTVRMTTAANTTYSQAYGIYVNEQLVAPLGNSADITIEANKVYGLQTTTTSELIYALSYFGDNNTNNSSVRIANNMFVNDRGSTSVTYYGMYVSVTNAATSTIDIYNNSLYLAGSAGTAYMLWTNTGASGTINHKNNIYHSTFNGTTWGVYVANTSNWTSNNNLIEVTATTGAAYAGYWNGNQSTLAGFKAAATPQESNSIGGNPQFVAPSAGDLHIDPIRPTPVESRGTPITSVPLDFDGQARHATLPDIGADEGNFNRGGIAVIAPNGGEVYMGGATIPIEYTADRPMSVRVEYSTNNGATWTTLTTTNPTATGTNTLSFIAPNVSTTQGRVRVISTVNAVEADTSNLPFRLVLPTVAIVSPNGGEQFYQGDVIPIRWSSVDIPTGELVAVEYSLNGGSSWSLIATNLVSNNVPATNSVNWVVPATQTTQGLVRVRMLNRPTAVDVSNGTFTILKSMNILSPVGGEQWLVGDRHYIKWRVNQVEWLNIEYSTNNGGTWTSIATTVRASLDSFPFIVPNTPTSQALVRIVNADQPTFTEQSATTFSILRPALSVLSPNGGERFEQSQPVNVTWSAANATTLRLEYSADGGASWLAIASGLASSVGSYTFTPPAFPTKLARVRLTDENRPSLTDMSDRMFEIMEPPGISIFNPSQNEKLMRGTVYEIGWIASRVNAVHIEYSATGGAPGSWVRIASSLPATTSRFAWTVPTTLTSMGKIRILEAGGPNVAESGIFQIIEPVASVRILRPNGGETYTGGDVINVSWTAALVPTVALQYTDDGGASWRPIVGAENLPGSQTSFAWTAPTAPGTRYRVRAVAGAIYDDSDNSFEIKRRIVPSITVLMPNGGENFAVDSVISVTWTAPDVTGDVTIEMSDNGGTTWGQIGTAPAATGTYTWSVPDMIGTNNMIRISSGAVADVSDAPFEISARLVASLLVLTPNAPSVIWTENASEMITWEAVAVGTVDIFLSTDNGATWGTTIATNVPATPGTYTWTVPALSEEDMVNVLVVKVVMAGTDAPFDVSDGAFTFRPAIAGIGSDAAAGGVRLFGAFPNPFASQTSVRWSQPVPSSATLRIFERDGRVAREIALGQRAAGNNAVTLDAGTLATGIYVYEIRVGATSAYGTLVIAR